jgi:hypothetical protein
MGVNVGRRWPMLGVFVAYGRCVRPARLSSNWLVDPLRLPSSFRFARARLSSSSPVVEPRSFGH